VGAARLRFVVQEGNQRLYVSTPSRMVAISDLVSASLVDDEWLDSGDVGSIDSDGNLRLGGRADWTILRGGRRIDPSVVEACLERMPIVEQAAVGSVPSLVTGEQDVVALVRVRGDAPADSHVLLRRHCRETLQRHLVPRFIFVVGQLPTLRDGSVARVPLANLVLELTSRADISESPCACSSVELMGGQL
jgi:acyl-coenzyme A synthetase/AMP-(fatty) acid ligase